MEPENRREWKQVRRRGGWAERGEVWRGRGWQGGWEDVAGRERGMWEGRAGLKRTGNVQLVHRNIHRRPNGDPQGRDVGVIYCVLKKGFLAGYIRVIW